MASRASIASILADMGDRLLAQSLKDMRAPALGQVADCAAAGHAPDLARAG